MLHTMSLRIRITLTAIVCLFAGLCVQAVVTAWQSRASVEASAMDNARTLAEGQAAQIASLFESTQSSVHGLRDALVGMKAAEPGPSRAQINAIMAELLRQNPAVLAFSNMWEPNALDGRDAEFVDKKPEHDKTGRFLPYWNRGSGQIAVEPLVDYDKAGANDWYEIPRKTMKDAMIEPYLYKVNGKDVLMTSLMSPMILGGKFVGVTGADFPLASLQERLGKIHPYTSGDVFLLSNGGLYATSPDPAQLGQPAKTLPEAALQAVKAGQPYTFVADGTAWLFAPFSIGNGGTPWSLCVRFPIAAVMGPANALVLSTVLVAFVVLVAVACLLVLLIGRATRPLASLGDTMAQFADGSGDLTHRLDVRGRDDISRIAVSFNAFADMMQSLVRDIRDSAGRVGREGERLGAVAADVERASGHQSEGAGAATHAMHGLTESIAGVAQSAQEADQAAQGTDALAREVSERIHGNAELIGGIHVAMQSVKERVVKLDDSAREINSIADVIKEIAAQTNLLALNAAIEAARAGEQGRGFAVVADEVRKLAERTTQATLQIGEMLGSVQADTEHAVRGVDEATGKVDLSVAQSGEVARSVEEIRDNIRVVATQIAGIATATAEQSASSRAVSAHIDVMADMTRTTLESVSEARQTSEQLQTSAGELLAQVGRFKV